VECSGAANHQRAQRGEIVTAKNEKFDWRAGVLMLFLLAAVMFGIMPLIRAVVSLSPRVDDVVETTLLALLGAPVIRRIVLRRVALTREIERLRADTLVASVLQVSADGVITTDANGIITQFNDGAEELFGYAAQDVLGEKLSTLLPGLPPSGRAECAARIDDSAPRYSVTWAAVQLEACCKDGSTFVAEVTVAGLGEGDDAMFTSVIRDTTERTRMYQARVASEERYRSLFSHMLNGLAYCMIICDAAENPVDFEYLAVNDAFERITGLRNVVGKPVSEVIPGIHEQSPELLAVYARVAATTIPETFEFNFRSLGQWLNISVYSPAAGTFVAVFDDITQRKQAEEELRLFRALVDRSNDMIQVIDPTTGRYMDVNDRCCRELGYSRHELLSMRVHDVDPTIDTETFCENTAVLRQTGSLRREGTNRRKDGTTFPTDISASYVKLDRDYVLSVVRDVSERKRLEADRSLQAAALNSAVNPIIITDRNGTIVWVNAALTSSTGYSSAEVVGRNPRALFKSGAHDDALYANLWSTVLRGDVWQGEMTNRRKDGTLYPEMQTINPVRDASGNISHFVAVKRDLTSEKKLQAQFLQAQKMESVGRLAGGVAHDFNNLLMVMNGWTEMTMADLPTAHPAQASLAEVLSAGEGAARLTKQLLAFSRQQVVEATVFNVNSLVTELEKMLRRLLGEDIKLATRADPDLGLVKMDRGQLEQVLMNLAVNARDAMPQGGRLLLETSNVTLSRETVPADLELLPGDYIMLAVGDTGTGMSDATRTHLFEPFFTTKQPGKGTGLGLATTFGIVHQARGGIEVSSQLGVGTTMRIYLPRTHEAERAAAPRSRKPLRRGVETVLLVEDEAAVRHVTAKMLELRGYRVLTASCGDEAMSLVRTHRAPVHLLLTDVVLADGMNGGQLAECLAKQCPGLKLIFMSGYTADVTLSHGLTEQDVALLQKPFTADALIAKVRQILDDA
jgi:two-component system cell cycle sensor histidine kinase/response regulator CckA